MTIRTLPAVTALESPAGYEWDTLAPALAEWAARPLAAEADGNTISIYDVIGLDPWTGEGFTAKRAAAALRSIGRKPVSVNIHSPGGDMFEGLAIFNLLREHPAPINVRVMGIAASAAALIAMSGDEILMGVGAQMMVHRAWGLVIGNTHDFADAAQVFDSFDQSMAAVYSDKTGIATSQVLALMDGTGKGADGTFMTAETAVELGFADDIFEADSGTPAEARASIPAPILARRRAEAALARAGVGRKERAKLLNLVSGSRDAAPPARRDAGDELAASLRALISTIPER